MDENRRREALGDANVWDLPMIRLAHAGRIMPPQSGCELIDSSITPSGEVVALWVQSAADAAALTSRTDDPGWASFPDARTAKPINAVVTVQGFDRTTDIRIDSLPVAHPFVQVLPGGRALLVGARCHWKPEGAERNALVYDAGGTLLLEATLGDGIERIHTTSAGDVWVEYFDEGMYGNYGWGLPGPEPIGAPGTVRFSSSLDQLTISATEGTPDGMCRVVGVDGDILWSSMYRTKAIVRFQNDSVQKWRNHVADIRALAIRGEDTWLVCGQFGHRGRLVRGRLTQDHLEIIDVAQIGLPDGTRIPAQAETHGSGGRLHVILDGDWYYIDVDAELQAG